MKPEKQVTSYNKSKRSKGYPSLGKCANCNKIKFVSEETERSSKFCKGCDDEFDITWEKIKKSYIRGYDKAYKQGKKGFLFHFQLKDNKK